jgi:hypothetical protein
MERRVKGSFFESEIALTPSFQLLNDLIPIHWLLLYQEEEQGIGTTL